MRTAVGFLTRIPVGRHTFRPQRSVVWFPIVGAAVGAAGGGAYVGASQLWHGAVAAIVAVAVTIAVTGALHEDGLADVADALGGPREEAERIRTDPRLGTFGVLALVGTVALRVGALASLEPVDGLLAMVAAHAASRATMAAVLVGRDAGSGLGASFAGTSPLLAGIAVLLAAAIGTAATGIAFAAVAGLAVIIAAAMVALARRRLGGMHGDALGATEQLVQSCALLVLAAGESGLGII